VEKCGGAREATYDNITRRMRFACWITKPADTHSEYVKLMYFFTATMVTRMPLNITLLRTFSALFAEIIFSKSL
jgi:hypothetical protein